MIAFAISSFFAGVAGAVFASLRRPAARPEYWNLFLSVEFIAILLIGGAGTVAGALLGTFFVVLLAAVRRGVRRLDERPGRAGAGRRRRSGT